MCCGCVGRAPTEMWCRQVVHLTATGDATRSVGAERLSEFLNIGYDQQVGARALTPAFGSLVATTLSVPLLHRGDPSHLGQKYSSKGRRQQRERFVSWPVGRKIMSRLQSPDWVSGKG